MRARQLTSRRTRERIAASVDQILAAAERPPWFGSAVPPARAGVAGAEAQLRALSKALRGPSLVYARGVALTNILLHDGRSPLYEPAAATAAEFHTRLALEALAGHR